MAPQPIAGGYVLVPTAELCAAWSLYRAKRIRLIDLRTWLACRELVARRRFARGHKVRFTHEELHRLVGGVGGEHVRGSVRRLEAANLLHWSETAIRFGGEPEAPDAVRDQIRSMVRQFSPARKFVPVPRRLLRLLAGGGRRAVIATLLAHLARCLFIRGGEAKPSGFCKASWVAGVFGVAERNVKDARAHLVALGVLVPNDVPQWRMNRFGKCVSLNVGWSRGGERGGGRDPDRHPSGLRPQPDQHPLNQTRDSLRTTRTRSPPRAAALGFWENRTGGSEGRRSRTSSPRTSRTRGGYWNSSGRPPRTAVSPVPSTRGSNFSPRPNTPGVSGAETPAAFSPQSSGGGSGT